MNYISIKLPKIKTKNKIQISFFGHPTLKPITSGNKGLSCVLPIKAPLTTKPTVDVEYYPISICWIEHDGYLAKNENRKHSLSLKFGIIRVIIS